MSSEDLKSLIVTDPDLVDPELDVSGLRTQTDTDPRLLASIADFPGISYDPTQFSYLTDLNELFAYGLPVVDTGTTTPETGTGTGGGGTGDGGQATIPGAINTLVTPSANTPEEQRLIDAGIGVQGAPGDPVVAPGEIPVTQQQLDNFNQIPVTPVNEFTTGDASLAEQIAAEDRAARLANVEDPTTMLPQLGTDTPTVFDGTATLEDAGAGEGGMQLAEVGLGAEADFTPLSTYDEAGLQIAEAPFGINPATGEPYQTPRTIADQNRVLGQTFEATDVDAEGNLLQSGIDKIKGLLPEDFDINTALIKTAFNAAIGKPVTLFLDIIKNLLPEQDPRQTALNEFYSTGAGAQYINPSSPNYIPGMENYNIVSGSDTLNKLTGGRLIDETTYGLQEAYQDRIDTIENTLRNKYGMTAAEIADVKAGTYKGDVQTDLLERLVNLEDAKKQEFIMLDELTDELGDVQQDLTPKDIEAGIKIGDAATAEETIGTLPEITEARQKQGEYIQEIKQQKAVDTTTQSGRDEADRQQRDTGVAKVETNQGTRYETSSGDRYASAEEAAEKGDGGGGSSSSGGGGCCFIMLEARYGNGTMDKVVRRYRDENMTPRNRRGYHKVAEVLVPLMRKSKIFKWIVTKTFADPLVSYGKWYYGENKHGWIFAPIKSAWLKLFDVVGTDTVFIRENGEEV